jgi:cytochrome P450
MSPRAVRSSATDTVQQKVYDVIAKLVAKGGFDAATELAHPLVADLIGEILGFPPELSNRFRVGSTAMFACLGPLNEHGIRGLPVFQDMIRTVASLSKDDLIPGSYGRALYEAGERGEVDPQSCGMLILNYAGPAYDTTIMAITSLIWLFARHPEQWRQVCDDPSLIPAAREEAIRIESPFQTWGRWCRKDSTFGDSVIPAESHVAILAGSANRDDRHYLDPDTFDVRRNPRDHLGFGVGVHNCVGAPLARLEIEAILHALAEQNITLALDGEPTRALANLVRGFDRLPVKVV